MVKRVRFGPPPIGLGEVLKLTLAAAGNEPEPEPDFDVKRKPMLVDER